MAVVPMGFLFHSSTWAYVFVLFTYSHDFIIKNTIFQRHPKPLLFPRLSSWPGALQACHLAYSNSLQTVYLPLSLFCSTPHKISESRLLITSIHCSKTFLSFPLKTIKWKLLSLQTLPNEVLTELFSRILPLYLPRPYPFKAFTFPEGRQSSQF